jgi:hypothetical protein
VQRELMLVKKGREQSSFVDPADPKATLNPWTGRWRTLAQSWTFSPAIENFTTTWSQLNFPRLLFQHRRDRGAEHGRRRSRRRRSSPTLSPGSGFPRPEHPVRPPAGDDHPARSRSPVDPQYVIFTRLGWNWDLACR